MVWPAVRPRTQNLSNSYPVEGYFRCFGNTVGTQKWYQDVTCALSRTLLERHSLGGTSIPDVTCNINGKKNIRHTRIMNVESTETSSSSVSVLKIGNCFIPELPPHLKNYLHKPYPYLRGILVFGVLPTHGCCERYSKLLFRENGILSHQPANNLG